MKHHNQNRKLGRKRDARAALINGLALSLIEKERITTTLARAKELRPHVEKLVTRAREDNLANRRRVIGSLDNTRLSNKLLTEIASKYKSRAGGYTRITQLPQRMGDASPMATIEFV